MYTAYKNLSTKFYEKIEYYSNHPKSLNLLLLMSFLESFIFPIPPDVMLVPMILAHPQKAFYYARLCSVASVIGGIIGYYIGMLLFKSLGTVILDLYGLQQSFHLFQTQFQKWGFWIIMAKGLTPIPFKVVTISSGLAHLNFGIFLLGSVITRFGRFFILAACLKYFGPKTKDILQKNFGLFLAASLFIIVIGFFLIKLVKFDG